MTPKNDKPEAAKNATPKAKKGGVSFRYIGTVAFLVLVIIAFVFFPSVARDPGNASNPVFGSFAGKPIAFAAGNYFARQVEAIDEYYTQQGYAQKDNQFYILQVWQQAFSRTAIHFGILDDAARAGLSVSKGYLDDAVMSNQAFLEDGVFSLTRYRETSPAKQAEIRDNLREEYLKTSYVTDLIVYRPSQKEKDLVKASMKRERSFEFVVFPFADYPKSEMAAYGAANPDNFTTLTLSRITMATGKAEAEQVKGKIGDNSMTFADAAKNYSTDSFKAQGGVMGAKRYYEITGDFKNKDDAKALLALKKGEVSPVYEAASGGWTFYRVEESAIAPDFTDDDTLKYVGIYMSGWERGRIEDFFLARARDFTAGAQSDFTASAARAGIEVKTAGPFPLNFGNPFNDPQRPLFKPVSVAGVPAMAGIESNEKFIAALWKAVPGGITEPVVARDAVAVARVKEETAAGDDTLLAIEYFYPSVCIQSFENTYYDRLLKSPRLKDNFMETFSKTFKVN
ncbi:MAG: SurA N-terminal domain-containing protein [Spirochaetes bacterium]|nr:SurA N-terminal domain-containing protein [Spirochaetota bacterium]